MKANLALILRRPILMALAFLLSVLAVAAQSWKFAVIGDTRGTGPSDLINTTILPELAKDIAGQQPVFVIASGDLVYSGSATAFQAWRGYMAPVYDAGITVFPVMGNHDVNDPNAFVQTFPELPDNGPTGEKQRTYAFVHDNVLVLSLDTYVNVGRVNQPWIDAMLATTPRTHLFAFGHMPAFKASHTDCLDDYPSQRDSFWNSLKGGGSRAYFCGHDHFYDHALIDDNDGNADNNVHQFIVGGGGAPLTGGYSYNGTNTVWTPKGVYHEMQYGYTVVTINGPTATMTYRHRTGANTWVDTSEVWSYTVPSGPTSPPAPTGLAAQAGDARIDLSWQASAGATTYNLKRSGNSAGPYTTIASGLTTTAYADTSVVNGTTYYYVVTALNSVGESGPSAYVGAKPQAANPVPAAPTDLNATSPKKGQIKLTWSPSSGALSYIIQRAPALAGPYATLKSNVTTTSYLDNKVTSRSTYYYVVVAVNGGAQSPPSNVATAVAK